MPILITTNLWKLKRREISDFHAPPIYSSSSSAKKVTWHMYEWGRTGLVGRPMSSSLVPTSTTASHQRIFTRLSIYLNQILSWCSSAQIIYYLTSNNVRSGMIIAAISGTFARKSTSISSYAMAMSCIPVQSHKQRCSSCSDLREFSLVEHLVQQRKMVLMKRLAPTKTTWQGRNRACASPRRHLPQLQLGPTCITNQ